MKRLGLTRARFSSCLTHHWPEIGRSADEVLLGDGALVTLLGWFRVLPRAFMLLAPSVPLGRVNAAFRLMLSATRTKHHAKT